MADSGNEYDAFLSYSTDPDYLLARDLEGFLGRFHELPMPDGSALRQLRIWRDETGRPPPGSPLGDDIRSILTSSLERCRFLVVLWSARSAGSSWMKFEVEWFLAHRGPGSVLLGVTDSLDPSQSAELLFSPEIVRAGLHRRPWHDLRGFRKEALAAAVKVRDYEDARVAIAADLYGLVPAEIQPIWWQNKVREQRERADREERARRELEVSECGARLEAARGWYERAFTFLQRRSHRAASRCLVNALTLSPPDRVPEHYPTSESDPGWSAESWALLRYTLAQTPRLLGSVGHPEGDRRLSVVDESPAVPLIRWCGSAGLIAHALGDFGRRREVADGVDILDRGSGRLVRSVATPDAAGPITAWTAGRATERVLVGCQNGWISESTAHAPGATHVRCCHHAITAVAFSAEEDRAVIGCAAGDVVTWSFADSSPASVEQGEPADDEDRAVSFVAFSRDGAGIVFCRGTKIYEWGPGARAEVVGFVHTAPIALDRRGRRLAYGDHDIVRGVNLVPPDDELATEAEPLIYAGHQKGSLSGVAYGAQDRRLVTHDIVGTLNVWRAGAEELRRSMSSFGANMTTTFGQSNRATHLKRLEGVGPIDAFDAHPVEVDTALVQRGGTIEWWDFGFAFEPRLGWRQAAEGSRCAVWMPDGTGIIVGSDDGSVQCVPSDAGGEKRVLREAGAPVGDIAVSRDGRMIAVATQDGAVVMLALASGRTLAETECSVPFSVAFARDDEVVGIGGGAGDVFLWNWRAGEAPERIGSHDDPVLGMVASPDGSRLFTSAHDVAAWDVEEQLQLWSSTDDDSRWGFVTSRPAISRDGQFIVVGGYDGTVRRLRARDGHCLATGVVDSSVPMKPEHVTALGVADDNRSGFAGLWDGTLVVLDLVSMRELMRFPAHSKVITSVAQFPGSADVLTGSLDPDLGGDNEFVRVWRLLEPGPIVDLPVAEADEAAEDWSRGLLDAFTARYGAAPADALRRRDHAGDVEFALSATPAAGEAAAGAIGELRAALRDQPRSAERNLDLAMALLAADRRPDARDLIRRVVRLGGTDLLIEPAATYLGAEVLLQDGDRAAALPLLLRAADHEEPFALLQLGLIAMTGDGVPRDEAAGVEFFRRSAAAGNVMAAHNIGVYYEHVAGGPVARTPWQSLAFGTAGPSARMRQAFDWYLRAAEGGHPAAQVRVGDFYRDGELVDQDRAAAKDWYQRAARADQAEAEDRLDALENE